MNRSQKISQKLLLTIGGIMLLGVAMLIVSIVAMSNKIGRASCRERV